MRILLPEPLRHAVLQQARREHPLECCGMLAGFFRSPSAVVEEVLPLANALASPTRFAVAPAELLRVHRQLRQSGRELLAVYHSHPTSAAVPSATDHAEHHLGEGVLCVIAGCVVGEWELRAWQLRDGAHQEVRIESDG